MEPVLERSKKLGICKKNHNLTIKNRYGILFNQCETTADLQQSSSPHLPSALLIPSLYSIV